MIERTNQQHTSAAVHNAPAAEKSSLAYNQPAISTHARRDIEADPAREAVEYDSVELAADAEKTELRNLKRQFSDTQIPKSPVMDVLRRADIDASHYTPEVLNSPQLLEALSLRKLLFVDASDGRAKEQIQRLVNDLNDKHVQGKPLVPSVDINDDKQLMMMIRRTAGLSADMVSPELAEKMLALTTDSRLSSANKKETFSGLLDDAVSQIKSAPLSQTTKKSALLALNNLSHYLRQSKITSDISNTKKQVESHLQFLEKSGATAIQQKSAGISVPLAGINLGANLSRTHQLSRKNDLNLFNEVRNGVAGNAGFSINRPAMGDDNSELVGLKAGLNYTRSKAKVHKTLGQLVDDIAAKPDSAKKALGGAAGKKARQDINHLHAQAKQQSSIRNNIHQTNHALQAVGLLKPDEELLMTPGYTRKLPQHRIIHAGQLSATAALGAGITPQKALGLSASAAANIEIAQEFDYSPKLDKMLSSHALLEHNIDKFSLDDIKKLKKEIAATPKNKVVDLSIKRQEVKLRILANLNDFKQYSQSVRNHDSASQSSSKFRRAFDRATGRGTESTQDVADRKHLLENRLNTHGRAQTLDKLLVKHAALHAMYLELSQPFTHDFSKSGSLDKSQPSGSEVFSLVNTHARDLSDPNNKRALDRIGVDYSRPLTRFLQEDKEFESMLDRVKSDLSSPQLELSNAAQRALHASTRTVNKKISATEQVQLNVAGQRFVVDLTQARSFHADPVKDRASYSIKVAGTGTLGTQAVSAIVAAAEKHSGQAIAEETKQNIFETVLENANAGYTLSGGMELELVNGNLSFIRGFVAQKAALGGALPIASGKLEASVISSRVDSTHEKIGQNSLHYPQIKFNGMLSAKMITRDGKPDAWTDFTQQHKPELSALAKKFADPGSGPSKELEQMIESPDRAYVYKHDDKQTLLNLRRNLQEIATQMRSDASTEGFDENFDRAMQALKQFYLLYSDTVVTASKNQRKDLMMT